MPRGHDAARLKHERKHMTSTQEPANPDDDKPAALRGPDRTDRGEGGEREVTFVWNLAADPDGGERQVVLSIMHHSKGRGGGAFSATVLNRTERHTAFGTEQSMGAITDWTRIASEPVSRYSQSRLDQFAQTALETFGELYGQGDEQARRYFQTRT
jgi:hypothetical protein